jgi:hypothetical protein
MRPKYCCGPRCPWFTSGHVLSQARSSLPALNSPHFHCSLTLESWALAIEPGWVGNGDACRFPAKTGGRRRAGVGALASWIACLVGIAFRDHTWPSRGVRNPLR